MIYVKTKAKSSHLKWLTYNAYTFIWTFRLKKYSQSSDESEQRKNSHGKSYSEVFDSWISTRHQGCKFQCTRKPGWTKKVCFISTLFVQRRNFSCERQTRFLEFERRFERLYCCHRYHVTEHVLLSTYANFRLFAFLLKSFSVLKVSKSTILF